MSFDGADLEPLPVDGPIDHSIDHSDIVQQRSPRGRLTAFVVTAVLVTAVVGVGVGFAVAQGQYREDVRELRAALAETQERHDDLLRAFRRLDQRAFVVVPNVVGLTLGEAQQRLRLAGLRPHLNAGEVTARESVVFAQEPEGGIRLPGGANVGLRTRA